MCRWRSLPSKETKKLFLLKLPTTRMDLLAHFVLHPPCFLETLWLRWNPPAIWTIPHLTALSQSMNIPLPSLILFFTLHTYFPNIRSSQVPIPPVLALSRIPVQHFLLSITHFHPEDLPVCLTQHLTLILSFP